MNIPKIIIADAKKILQSKQSFLDCLNILMEYFLYAQGILSDVWINAFRTLYIIASLFTPESPSILCRSGQK